ncbi:MAG: hypothetical protein PHI48_09155 [Bacteroidales bacterium]|nr:hypothetical protein [Bacteroidales bacterium]
MKSPLFLAAMLLNSLLSVHSENAQNIDLQKLTGKQTRVVWVRDFSGKNRNSSENDNKLKIVGFDSKEGKEHVILDQLDGYTKPLFTPDGDRIVFTNLRDKQIYTIDWDGKNLRKIVEGNLADVWQDPKNKKIWAYYQTGFDTKAPLYRTSLDGGGKPELVWNATPLNVDNFQFSRDGKYASGLFPWPKGGVANMETKEWQLLGNGCWTSLAPDNSRMFWIFDGAHRNVFITTQSGKRWVVPVGDAEGINGFEVYHPRWSNSPRFITVTGPYMGKGGEPGGNRIGNSYTEVEVYVGRFNADYTSIEAWTKITNNKVADYFPDVWVKEGEKEDIPEKIAKGGAVAAVKTLDSKTINRFKEWPGTDEGLVFLWENATSANQIQTIDHKKYSTQLELTGKAVYGFDNCLDLAQGVAKVEGADDNILRACQKSNQLTIEAGITTDRIDQKGPARIISFSGNASSRNFTLGQTDNHLVLRLRTPLSGENGSSPEIVLGEIQPNVAMHVIVTYASGQLHCYFNGKAVNLTETYQGDFSNWASQHLLFGDEWGGGRNWDGKLEGIALFNRFFSDKEAAKHYALWQKKIKERKMPETIVVEATPEKISVTPEPSSIAPYRRCLAEYVYKVNKVQKGTLKGERIIVTHWVILDGKKNPVAVKKGEKQTLTLQRFDDHKELQGERLVSDFDEFDLERYVDMKR